MSYRISIEEPRPWRELLRILLFVLALIALFYVGYLLGQQRGQQAGGMVSEERALRISVSDMLQGQVAQLEELSRKLKAKVALAEQNSSISNETVSVVQSDLLAMQIELKEAQKLLDFYTGIVSPADARGGLRLHDFTLRAVTDRAYSYKLVLVQTKNHDRVQLGRVMMEIEGVFIYSGEPVVLAMADVTYPPKDDERYGFRYFQEFSGDIALPDGFLPTRLKLEVKPTNRDGNKLNKIYDWSEFTTIN